MHIVQNLFNSFSELFKSAYFPIITLVFKRILIALMKNSTFYLTSLIYYQISSFSLKSFLRVWDFLEFGKMILLLRYALVPNPMKTIERSSSQVQNRFERLNLRKFENWLYFPC